MGVALLPAGEVKKGEEDQYVIDGYCLRCNRRVITSGPFKTRAALFKDVGAWMTRHDRKFHPKQKKT